MIISIVLSLSVLGSSVAVASEPAVVGLSVLPVVVVVAVLDGVVVAFDRLVVVVGSLSAPLRPSPLHRASMF